MSGYGMSAEAVAPRLVWISERVLEIGCTWVIAHGRYPACADLYRRGMPSYTAVAAAYGGVAGWRRAIQAALGASAPPLPYEEGL